MATKDRAAALGLTPAPERALRWLLGGRDDRLLLVAIGALLAHTHRRPGRGHHHIRAVTRPAVDFLRRKPGP